VCTAPLKVDAVVEVLKVNDADQFVGNARVMWVDSSNAPWPVAGFRFGEKPRQWVVK
jgi:hypothetical protein